MAHDLVISGASIVDGSGRPAYHGAIAIDGGKIVALGELKEKGRRHIDAGGLTLAPGFIDPHTHFDAQITWDPLLSPSCWHGVTTVLMGNCGVGVAPCLPARRDELAWDLVNVEAVPHGVMQSGVPWEWESFGDYLGFIRKRGIALNALFLVPLSALRMYVMGEAACERQATEDETRRMADVFREAMLAGAYGFSASLHPRHVGYLGRPLSSRLAGRHELAALCRVMRELARGVIEIIPNLERGVLSDQALEQLAFLAEQSGRPVTWTPLVANPSFAPGANEDAVKRCRPYLSRGLRIVPQTTARPIKMYYDLRTPSLCGEMPSWKPAFNRPREEQIALYRSTEFRNAFRADIQARRGSFFNGEWEAILVARVSEARNRAWLNRSIAEIAAATGKDGVDAFLDLAIDEQLELGITVSMVNADRAAVEKLLSYPDVLLGLSDAGAHLTQHCEAGASTYLLQEWVRNRGALTLERAVQRLTSEPAGFLGLARKGRLAPGMDADLVLFDPQRVALRPLEWTNDLPDGSARIVEQSAGYAFTLVGGKVTFAGIEHQGILPGEVVAPMPG